MTEYSRIDQLEDDYREAMAKIAKTEKEIEKLWAVVRAMGQVVKLPTQRSASSGTRHK